tara:strand:- start:242 stop:496 length:255 start_codon:yes stop_codon:yes gene_type:complete
MSTIKKITFFLNAVLIITFLKSCNRDNKISAENELCINEDLIDETVACYLIYAPVCGCNNETYSNDCIASSNGVLSYTEGACNE